MEHINSSSSGIRKWLLTHEKSVVTVLLFLTVVLRLAALTQLPANLNQDEASTGYEAWALLNYGIDRCGNRWPVLLTSWGSGQNILYSWLDIPFIAVLGLNLFSLRLPAALAGIVTVIIFWRLARKCRGIVFGLCALLLITINPWHIMASRWALESNIMPMFLLIGLFFTIKAQENIRWLFGAAISFSLALYAYGTAFFFVPIFLVIYVLINRTLLREKTFYLAGFLFLLLSFPIVLCQVVNYVGADGFTVLGMTIPKLTEARQVAVSVFGTGLSGLTKNIRDFFMLLITQSDGLRYNALPYSGLYYFFGLPLAAVGIFCSIKERKQNKKELPLVLALLVCCLCACFISININRINMVWLPLLYFQAVGLGWIQARMNVTANVISFACVLLCFTMFLVSYAKEIKNPSNVDGLNDAIAFAETISDEDIYITNTLPAPYIHVLFHRQISPVDFNNTVVYNYPNGAFRNAVRFGRYCFSEKGEVSCLVLARSEYSALDADEYILRGEFGNYIVCSHVSEKPNN